MSAGTSLFCVWVDHGSLTLNFDWHCDGGLWIEYQVRKNTAIVVHVFGFLFSKVEWRVIIFLKKKAEFRNFMGDVILAVERQPMKRNSQFD